MAQRRIFTLEEANALLPRVRLAVARQLERRSDIEQRLKSLSSSTGTPPESVTPHPDDSPAVRDQKQEVVARLQEYQTAWNELEDLGIVVKDTRTGLLDFYARIDDKLVFLCWRYDEEVIGHYHEVEAGFAGRRPIVGAVKTRLYN